MQSCEASGNNPNHHFADAGKMVDLGFGGVRGVEDYQLSRFACYLIAQNGDPRKPQIAQAQEYFAIQARRQELSDELAADVERLELRKQTAEEFKALSGAARRIKSYWRLEMQACAKEGRKWAKERAKWIQNKSSPSAAA